MEEDKLTLNLLESFNIPDNITKLTLTNVTQLSFYQLIFPQTLTHLILYGNMDNLIIPDGITDIECNNLGLIQIYISESVEYLQCTNNNLKTIELPKNILCASIDNNKITKIICREPLTRLFSLTVNNNLITDFDIKLPNTVSHICIAGNKDIKFKYLEFLFFGGGSSFYKFIDGDIVDELGIRYFDYHEHLRARLYSLCTYGETYIDLKQIGNDNYYFKKIKNLCPDIYHLL
jgi:hypothetical protein